MSAREPADLIDDGAGTLRALLRTLERAGYAVPDGERASDRSRIAVEPELLRTTVRALLRLRASERAARRALKTCDEFLSITSHDIRGLLHALRLTLDVQLMKAADADIDREAMVRTIRRSIADVQQMTRLVDDILDRAQIQEGKLSLRLKETDLAALVADRVQRSAAEAARSRSPIQLDAPEPVIGRFDPLRIDQIVANLLSNAMKYGAGEPIAVGVRRVDGMARITISDRGPGIADAEREHVFDRFDRGSASSRSSGYGLGLWIVRELARLHGGVVTLESAPGRGTTFTVTLPIAQR